MPPAASRAALLESATTVSNNRVHVASDEATWLAYVEALADEQQATAIGFLSHAVAWVNGKGVECRQ